MFNIRYRLLLLSLLLTIGTVLSACGSDSTKQSGDSTSQSPQSASASSTSSSPSSEGDSSAALGDNETRQYKDFSGREATIPVRPQRVILLGDSPGDLLALGVKPIGNDFLGEAYIYKSDLDGVVDIGFPHNLEKMMSLDPDLILQSADNDASDTEIYEKMTKIAPTVLYNRGAGTYERIREIANILGVKQAAEDWIARYESKAQKMWDKLDLKEGETATVYLSLAGRFYVMGNYSLTLLLYDEQGFRPTAKVQELIDKNEFFAEISEEVLPEYAGDHIFLLSLPGSEDEKAAKELIESPLWKLIPAVKEGRVTVSDISWNASDPITMERLLDELPKWLGK
ncbi:ABC transporter substrate-binding protein [Paenibacillus sp. GCM10012307]|uniref:ABC transporter substrate-binding protein n=1 Tax=Paenibacillus roseus TaxID=2798579 RepID=A0A934IZP5_9BACL|nr:ABC transporter substrate-binding protein [Paenibacillus roseus]MBJ6360030.1 ABC transporter substrate-binding protein [Paenibacillus roseus]